MNSEINKMNSKVTKDRYLPYTHLCILFFMFVATSCIEDKVDPLYSGSLQGTVISQKSNTPIAEVEISTAPVTTVVFTDSEGKFYIDNIPEGEYTVLTETSGYSRESIKVKVLRNATTTLSIKLSNATILAPPPLTPFPADKETHQPLTVQLKWSVKEYSDDSLLYTVRLFESNMISPLLEVTNLKDTTLLVDQLRYNTTYYWQVQVMSSTGYLTAGDLWLFKTIPFPDNRVTFTSKRNGNYEIYSAKENGDSVTRLTNSSSYELKPLFDGSRENIAFASNNAVDYQIYMMKKDGSGTHRITTLPIAGYHNQGIGFSWSPDYGKFIYSHYNKLYKIDRDGINLTLLATAPANRNFRACHWTATGNKIVVETIGTAIYDTEIYLMNADGTDTVRLVNNLPGIVESPSFSIDGKEILYTHDVSGYESADGRQLDGRIFIMNIETQETTEVSDEKTDGTNDSQPRFSPDGSKIIFTNAANDGSGVKSVWIMDRNGANRVKLFDNAEMPHWQ